MDIWSSLLESALISKTTTSRTILLLGGSPTTQESFIQQIVASAESGVYSIKGWTSQIANEFALGYVYFDVFDRDQEDVILRINIYTLSSIYDSYARLIVDLLQRDKLTFETVLVTILLDWEEPRRWVRDLAQYIKFLKELVFKGLDRDVCASGLRKCSQRYRQLSDISFTEVLNFPSRPAEIDIPLGKGEYDAPLGVEMLVAVMNSERIDVLEQQFGRKDDEFDFIQQFLRTVLLKHGAALVYLSSESKSLFPLLFYLLSPSLLSEQSRNILIEASKNIQPNVVDRGAILIPSGWDSWSKILLIKEGFDVDGVSSGWSTDVLSNEGDMEGIIEVYEDVVHAFGNPPVGANRNESSQEELEIHSMTVQEFLKGQLADLNSIEVS
ncbi:dynein light intermediate chain-domain-containing protein [Lipomyces chichibuensis]|uniref:dynein light intermediate chain-domain-containing protein n=1 Tax=Lipomyces chichibuensis TaxID=1546026 RepID=UPI0033434810